MTQAIFERTLKQLQQKGKGILAADESVSTIGQRFEKLHIFNSEEKRRQYRELLFSTPKIKEYIGGVILFEETLQETSKGRPLPELLLSQEIVVGCKADQGLLEVGDEFTTKGLEDLASRLKKYYFLGVRFAKWRAVFQVARGLPSPKVLKKNAEFLALYAKTCLENKIIPIVEPEVLSTGGHSSDECFDTTEKVLRAVFNELEKHQVPTRWIILKPNMVVPGSGSGEKMVPEKVANMTVGCLMSVVPKDVPIVAFLSGGQSEAEACLNMNAIAQHENLPWFLTYSFGRALQNSTMSTWKGNGANTEIAQRAFMHRARLTSLAQQGKYSSELEDELIATEKDQ